jgi:hypothetical protein
MHSGLFISGKDSTNSHDLVLLTLDAQLGHILKTRQKRDSKIRQID